MGEYGQPHTHVGRIHEYVTYWEVGEQLAMTNCRPLKYLGSESRVVEVETTTRFRHILPPKGDTND